MGKTFRKWTCYPLWEAHNEERDLNIASKNGNQLVKGGAFSWILEKNDTVRYTYQIDFNPGAKLDPRYKETFAEMGWEYISSTFNGWHYFKKPYQEGQQLENGDVVQSERIYTDETSFNEMENRWQKLATVLYSICFVFCILYLSLTILGNRSFGGFCLGFLFFGLSIFTSIRNYKQKKEDPNFIPKFEIPFRVIFPIFLIITVITFFIGIL